MSTSIHEDRKFIIDVIGDLLLEKAVDWVGKNLEPENVFNSSKLTQWAKDWLPRNIEPSAIFSVELLEEWAESNEWQKP